jgi:lysine N-acyltransferase
VDWGAAAAWVGCPFYVSEPEVILPMSRPHLAEAWESVGPASRWRRYLRAQRDGDCSRLFVGSLDGEDHGYVELYRAAKDSIATRYGCDPMI